MPHSQTTFIKLLPIVLIFLNSCVTNQYHGYKGQLFSKIHPQTMAIVPFSINIIARHLPQNVNAKMLKQYEQEYAYEFQQDIYDYFIKQSDSMISIQSAERTRNLLSKAGIEYRDIALYNKNELAQALGVDCVMVGKMMVTKLTSTGRIVAKAFMWGSISLLSEARNKYQISLDICEKENGLVLWSFKSEGMAGDARKEEKFSALIGYHLYEAFPYKTSH
jgi:hypothetical protein